MLKPKTAWNVITALSAVGIILASYLFYSYLVPEPPQFCTINETINCDAVTKGSLATFVGIPVSLVGLIGYIVIFASSVFQKKKLTLGMTAFGMIFCLRLTILEIFVEKVYCPVCLLCQIIMLTVFLLSIYLLKAKEAQPVSKEEAVSN